MEVAKTIRDGRRAAGLTQAELAERARTSQPAVNRYEQGVAVPSLPTLERILEACGRRLTVTALPVPATPLPGPLGHLVRRRRAALLQAARGRGARTISVFGSVARGDDEPGSDVDLLVELEPGRTLLDLAGLRREAEGILGVAVDVATPEMLKERVRERVLAEAAPL